MIKRKQGICCDCTDGKLKPIYAKGRCENCYWRYRKTQQKVKQPKPRKPIRKVSKKQAKRNKEYSDAATAFFDRLAQRQGEPVALCEIRLPGCTNYATQRHHQEGRIGELLNDETKQLGTCHNCHSIVELNPLFAKENNFSLSRITSQQQ